MAKTFYKSAIILLTLLTNGVLSTEDCSLIGFKKENSARSKELLNQIEKLKGNVYTTSIVQRDKDVYMYSVAICSSLHDVDEYSSKPKVDKYAGVVQVDTSAPSDDKKYHVMGRINSTLIKGGSNWVMLTYQYGDLYGSHCKPSAMSNQQSRRQAHIMMVCDPSETKGKLKMLYEERNSTSEENCYYLFELSTNAVCNEKSGLSSGSIFLIVFFTLGGTYLLIGMAYKRFVYGSKGWDQIPNRGFWKSFGALQADGCDFLCRCQESGYNNSAPYRGIADDQLEDEADDEHLLPM